MADDDLISFSELQSRAASKQSAVLEPIEEKQPQLRSMGDIQSLNKVGLSLEASEQLRFILPEETATKLRQQPEIGFWESARRNISSLGADVNLLGRAAFDATVVNFFAGLGLVDVPEDSAVFRISRALEGKEEPFRQAAPLRSPTLRLFALKNSADRLQANKYDGNFDLRNRDIKAMTGFFAELEEERIRGTTIRGKVVAGLLEVPTFVATFIATGGLASLGKKGVEKGISFALKRELTSKTGIFVSKTLQTGAGAIMRTAASPHLVARSFADRRLQANIEPLEKGFQILSEARETPAISLMKAFGDTFVEFFSEETGKAIGIVGSKFVPKGLLTSFRKVFQKIHPGIDPKVLATKVGWNGFLQELGEERVGDIMRASFGITEFDPNSTSTLDQIIASWPNWEEAAVEIGVIGITGAGIKGTASAIDFIQQRKAEDGIKEPVDREISDEEAVGIAVKPAIEPLPSEEEIQEILAGKKPPPAGVPLAIFKAAVEGRKERRIAAKKIPLPKKIEIPAKEKVAIERAKEKFPEQKVVIEGREKRLEEELESLQTERREIVEKAAKESKKIDVGITAFEKQQDVLREKRSALLDEFRPTEAINAQIETLDTRIDDLRNQRTKILQQQRAEEGKLEERITKAREAFSKFLFAPKPEIRPAEKIVTTPQKIFTALRARVKQAQRFAKGEARAVQTQLINALTAARIPTKPFLKTIRDIQTLEQLEKKLPEFEKRIAEAVEVSAKRKTISSITKRLKTAKPITQAGKLVGKFIPEIQTALDTIRKAVQIRAEIVEGERINPAQELINQRIRELGDEPPSVQFAQENAILDVFSDLAGKTSKELAALDAQIESFISEGRRLAAAKKVRKRTEAERIVDISMTAVQGRSPVLPTSSRKKTLRAKIVSAYTTGKNSLSGFADVIEVIDNTQELEKAVVDIGKLAKKGDKLSSEELRRAKKELSELVESSPLLAEDKAQLQAGIPPIETAEQLGIVNKLIGKQLSGLSIKGLFAQLTDVTPQEQKEKGDVDRSGQKIIQMAFRAFGFTRQGQFVKQMEADNRLSAKDGPGDFGNMIDVSGQTIKFHLTKAEARKIKMELDDPSLEERIRSEDSGYKFGAVKIKGLTQDMIDRVNEFLTEEDIRWIKEQRIFYQEIYDKEVRPLYKKFYGIDPGTNKFYTPTSRVVGQQDTVDAFLQELNIRRTTAPGSLKSRTKTQAPLRIQSDINVLTNYIYEMNHWLNWADKDRTLQTIFGNSDVKDLIKEKYGNNSLQIIDGYIQNFRSRGKNNARLHDAAFDLIRRNITISALALKISSIPKQITSFIAFSENIPVHSFLLDVLDFATHPIRSARTLDKVSDFVRTRGGNISRDIKDIANSKEFSLYRSNQNIPNLLLFTTRLGDRWGILPGAWAVYRHTLRKTGSRKSAVAALEAKGSQTQQSGDLSKLSKFQNLGSIGKLFTMFTSAQNQYLRRELSALDGIIRRKITAKQFAKTIAIYHFALPTFFQFVSDFGRWDEDEQRRARWFGSLNGIFILNDILDAIIRGTINIIDEDADLEQFRGGLIPLDDLKQGVIRGMEAMDKDGEEIEVEELLESFGKLVVGPATGLPIKRLYDGYEGITDLKDEDIFDEGKTAKGILKILGWTPRTVEAGFKKEEEKELKELFEE